MLYMQNIYKHQIAVLYAIVLLFITTPKLLRPVKPDQDQGCRRLVGLS